MTSILNDSTAALLASLGFELVRRDPSRVEHWLSQEQLPHVHITLDPGEFPLIADIVRAIHAAGVRDQRDITRTAWNHLADTFRHGQPVQSPDDILALTEPKHDQ